MRKSCCPLLSKGARGLIQPLSHSPQPGEADLQLMGEIAVLFFPLCPRCLRSLLLCAPGCDGCVLGCSSPLAPPPSTGSARPVTMCITPCWVRTRGIFCRKRRWGLLQIFPKLQTSVKHLSLGQTQLSLSHAVPMLTVHIPKAQLVPKVM